MKTICFAILSFGFLALTEAGNCRPPPFPVYANCIVRGPDAKIQGTVNFTQLNSNMGVLVSGKICGLEPNSKHGFHIHQYGDLSGGCATAQGHFNPFNKTHGDRIDRIRHVGDLGNIEVGDDKCAEFHFEDPIISLDVTSKRGILGRACMLHSGQDDLGRGNNADSKVTGNSGTRLGCGVIGYAPIQLPAGPPMGYPIPRFFGPIF
jgi:Cu-Zn family superoxide dismutase